ncbi:MAG: PTS sugar transporter subunit IIA [Erysipelotrichaceae bacterium]|jgi:PTS system galactitol-specific IIA component|nr:PTS sugar transporter subunit IIA [Erysipelotrichaceae bacterium]MBQ1776079.1 PTS sugar transporter subunit IIA [Erysipelotrichaceae bacterium]MBQ1911109.1 PTS sugar transporter subunit IIA [Erysipelotrichaceae bacterium]MBQ2233326.1 PTS sugar transporter subunit IIA [Erysipelotrichaceae bacterium]MBQ2506363.1 PTS sugar transporter subunit IIA [Erysipelotrichaceae bacterium]
MADMFDAKIALFHKHADSRDEALKMLADEFMKSGVAKDTFFDGILSRENVFATGLTLNNMCVAIPHTDPEHVNRTQIGFMSLDAPVEFVEMGTEDKKIPVTMLFMLALKEAHQQLDMLMKLMDAFQNDELMEKFKNVSDFDEYLKLVKEAGLDLEG